MEQSKEVGTPPPGTRRLCVALVALAILSIVGTFIAFELTDVYVRARIDPEFQSFCAVNKDMNCETVAMSDFATLAGVPTSVWATSGYLFALFLAVFSLVRIKDGFGRGFILVLSLVFNGASFSLIYVMSVIIKSLCILCLALDVVNLGILAMALLAAKTGGGKLGKIISYDFASFVWRPLLPAAVAIAGIGLLAGGYVYGTGVAEVADEEYVLAPPDSGPETDDMNPPGQWTNKVDSDCGQECPCNKGHQDKTINMGMDYGGHPWIGSKDGELVIEEFTDYQCPYCRKAHLMVRKLLSNHPGKIKVYHRHYPLDVCNPRVGRAFHPRACELSRVSVCAGRQGRFWEMSDFLFQHAKEIKKDKISATDLARRLELNLEEFECCMEDDSAMPAIQADIKKGIELELEGTPAFLINGTVYYGKIPDEAVGQLK